MSPSKTGPAKRIALQANICYRCDALPKIFSEYGLMEMLHNNALQHEKETLIAYDGMRVSHIQSLGLIGSCAINFHNGRSIAGYRLLRISFLERCLRTLTFLLLPPYMLARNVINLLEKRRGLLFVARVLPFMSLLLVCHAFGEFLGYLGGPASSPTRLR
jgi:hypothetical protein